MSDREKLHDALAEIRAVLPAENDADDIDQGQTAIQWLVEKLREAASGGCTAPPAEVLMAAAATELEKRAAAPRPDLTELRALAEGWELSGSEFRTVYDCADELKALIERMGGGALARLERTLAQDNAIVIIESSGIRFGVEDGWLGKSDDDVLFDDALRYLELRGLLERHPEHPDWVRVKEPADVKGG